MMQNGSETGGQAAGQTGEEAGPATVRAGDLMTSEACLLCTQPWEEPRD